MGRMREGLLNTIKISRLFSDNYLYLAGRFSLAREYFGRRLRILNTEIGLNLRTRTCSFCVFGCCVGSTEGSSTRLIALQRAETVVGMTRMLLFDFSVDHSSNEHYQGGDDVATHFRNDECVYGLFVLVVGFSCGL